VSVGAEVSASFAEELTFPVAILVNPSRVDSAVLVVTFIVGSGVVATVVDGVGVNSIVIGGVVATVVVSAVVAFIVGSGVVATVVVGVVVNSIVIGGVVATVVVPATESRTQRGFLLTLYIVGDTSKPGTNTESPDNVTITGPLTSL
jgi:hypothetical protein